MSIPAFFALMLPILKVIADKQELHVSEIRRRVADSEKLTQEDLAQQVSGGVSRFGNRVAWALTEMFHAKLAQRTGRGIYQITDRGLDILANSSIEIDRNVLRKFPEYSEWENSWQNSSSRSVSPVANENIEQTPYESIEIAFSQLNDKLEREVLERVRNLDSNFLERLIVELLVEMGYGGGNLDRGKVTAKSRDGGIDGVISEDALGLDEVYIQAKKYKENSTIGEPELRNFVGAIDSQGTAKGIFVTTSSFSRAAQDYVRMCSKQVVLIDGSMLAQLMVKYGVGFRSENTYVVKRIDEDYFEN